MTLKMATAVTRQASGPGPWSPKCGQKDLAGGAVVTGGKKEGCGKGENSILWRSHGDHGESTIGQEILDSVYVSQVN